jgi:hypothetical protein
MPREEGSHWIKMPNRRSAFFGKDDGKWVLFLDKSRRTRAWIRQGVVEAKLRLILGKHGLREIWVLRASPQVALAFTSADRHEIRKVEEIFQQELALSSDDMLWKSNAETERDWIKNEGQLWFLAEILNEVAKKEKALSGHRRPNARAQRIQSRNIDRLISLYHRRILEETDVNRTGLVVRPCFPTAKYKIAPKTVFVLMPFKAPWSDDLYSMIKRACRRAQLKPTRADDSLEPNIVMNEVWQSINEAGLVLADVSKPNSNVYYELGIAHAIGKRVILLKKEGTKASPFDVQCWRYLKFALSGDRALEFEQQLAAVLQSYARGYESWPCAAS